MSSRVASLPGALAVSAGLGAALAAVALLGRGGNNVGRMAGVEIALVLVAGLVLAAALLSERRGRPLYGSLSLLCFATLTAVTALSMTWSIAPDDSLVETARSFAYMAIFAAAVAGARLAPSAAPVVLRGILLAAVAVVAYALASRIWPGSFHDVLSARLGEPYDYWSALASTAALAVPLALWLGTRQTGSAPARGLAMPALGLLILTILLTQSRGALVAAALAVVLWLVVAPPRLRTLVVLAVPALAAAPVAAWALSKDAFTVSLQTLSQREAVAGGFGVRVLLMTALLTAAGLAWERVGSRHTVSLPARRRLGVALLVAACILPLVVLTSVAVSSRGLSGTVSDRVHQLTDDKAVPPQGAARLGSLSSSRAGYWRQSAKIVKERPTLGTGAGTFGLARLRYRKDEGVSRHAHGFIPQTAADMGLLGLAVALALLAAWLAAAARATGLTPRRGGAPRPDWSDERMALFALALCSLAFGFQSAVDWTWFVPGPSAMALVAAGLVAGRGPLPALGAPAPGRTGARGGGRPRATQILGAAGVLVTAALCVWAVWQPEASKRASERAFQELAAGDLKAAAREADQAREINPYSPEPLFAKAAVLTAAHRDRAAYHTLERAVIEHPRDPEIWLRLGRFELEKLDLPERAIETAGAALRLDPHSPRGKELTKRAKRATAAGARAG